MLGPFGMNQSVAYNFCSRRSELVLYGKCRVSGDPGIREVRHLTHLGKLAPLDRLDEGCHRRCTVSREGGENFLNVHIYVCQKGQWCMCLQMRRDRPEMSRSVSDLRRGRAFPSLSAPCVAMHAPVVCMNHI